jgi:hypothetical protein
MHHCTHTSACCVLLLIALGIAQGLALRPAPPMHARLPRALTQGSPGSALLAALGRQQHRAVRQPSRRAAAPVAEQPANQMRSIAAPPADRPAFHLMPRQGWVNDPNGPLLVNDKYHM